MSVLIDLNLVCVICLQEEGGELLSVYSNVVMDPGTKMTIANRISLCSKLNLDDINIKISKKICASCLEDLSVAWRFRKQCEKAYSLFRSIQQQEDVISLTKYSFACEESNKPSKNIHSSANSEASTSPLKDDNEPNAIANETYAGKCPDDAESFTSVVEYVEEEGQKDAADNIDYFDCLRDGLLEEVDDEFENENESNNTKEVNSNTPCLQDDFNDEYSLVQIKEEFTESLIENVSNDTIIDENLSAIKVESEAEKIGYSIKYSEDREKEAIGKENSSIVKGKRVNPAIKTKQVVNFKNSTTMKTARARKKSSGEKEKPFYGSTKICEICGNIYKFQHALIVHMRRHNNDRQFGCEICEKAFVSNVELRRHMRVHTGHRPYPCSFCDRRFSDFGSRSKHERTHTGERPYRCTTCNKSFAYAHVLTVHIRTHTGEKKFQCTRCDRGFTKKVYLLNHLENHKRCESISLITNLNESDVIQQDQQKIIAMKRVTFDESIYTSTESDISQCLVELEETIEEEHLEEETNDSNYILGVKS